MAMIIGVPKEIKNRENRVGCTPDGVQNLVSAGHEVLVEQGAGVGSGFTDAMYRESGATLVPHAADAWAADMVFKVKEPIEPEYDYLRRDLVLFCYLHLAAEPELARRLVESGTTAIAFETITEDGRLPLLEPMSEIAGSMSPIMGAYHLSSARGGTGNLICGVPGVLPIDVMVLGGGTAGVHAARMAAGMGAKVTILEINLRRMRELDLTLPPTIRTLYSNENNITDMLSRVDLLIGAVLLPGAKAPRLVRREMLSLMKAGSVLVDIAIDQGGCIETSHPTTHDDPVFTVDNIIHYCVANMPGAYARTATQSLANATLPYAVRLANLGPCPSLDRLGDFRDGLNTYGGAVTNQSVVQALGMHCERAEIR